jgi:hypothetical protein
VAAGNALDIEPQLGQPPLQHDRGRLRLAEPASVVGVHQVGLKNQPRRGKVSDEHVFSRFVRPDIDQFDPLMAISQRVANRHIGKHGLALRLRERIGLPCEPCLEDSIGQRTRLRPGDDARPPRHERTYTGDVVVRRMREHDRSNRLLWDRLRDERDRLLRHRGRSRSVENDDVIGKRNEHHVVAAATAKAAKEVEAVGYPDDFRIRRHDGRHVHVAVRHSE